MIRIVDITTGEIFKVKTSTKDLSTKDSFCVVRCSKKFLENWGAVFEYITPGSGTSFQFVLKDRFMVYEHMSEDEIRVFVTERQTEDLN